MNHKSIKNILLLKKNHQLNFKQLTLIVNLIQCLNMCIVFFTTNIYLFFFNLFCQVRFRKNQTVRLSSIKVDSNETKSFNAQI